MIIIITSQTKDLDSQPNPQFGRTPYFIKYDLESDEWEALENPAQKEPGGAGIAAAQFVIDNNAKAVVSGRFGPNAHDVLRTAGVELLTFDANCTSIKQVIKSYKEGSLTKG
ncbi:MAG TPA: NifB/NifX family molybdenum-iron cluster-binding protein [Brevefilum sp.]|nr:NifB/NifX family molybdenum-iron cluster-binding protein [Brevefilum sp.]HOR18366.1 NifB/NifX family molybdenum-iron cluster-binding protein [Brevefilum sp.]